MKLLIGHDGSDCADAAIDDLRRAGLPEEGEALVLSVADVWPQHAQPSGEYLTTAPADWMRPALRDARALVDRELGRCNELASRAADRLRTLLPGWRINSDAALESPQWAIVKKANESRPDLVVLGSHGRSALSRLILGSVSQSVLTHVRCSVRIGRRGPRADKGPARILVGIDGSIGAATAVSAVSMRRWPQGSEVRVVAAIDSAISTAFAVAAFTPVDSPRSHELPHDWVARAARRVAKELHESGLLASPLVCQGDPNRVLIEEAEQWGADCIFVGARGLRRLERLLLGSVSSAVAARAHCSVEVVRQSE